jgi:hypothetical protein
LRGRIAWFTPIELAEQPSHGAPESSCLRQVIDGGDQRCRPNSAVLGMPVLINDVIRSKDDAHTHVARQFFETKQCGAIRKPGNRQTVFAQARSQIVVPQLGNIAANCGSQDACAVQFGCEPAALFETLVKNGALKRDAIWPRVPAENRHLDQRSG